MRFLTRVAIYFYCAVIITVAFLCLGFYAHIVELKNVVDFLTIVYEDKQAGAILGGLAILIILMSVILANLILGRQQKERTIAFENPSGLVSVSLDALEDIIRRLIARIPEIKEIRPYIVKAKKSLEVDIRLILRSDGNIPELTAKLQDLVRGKIQDAIGLDEKINVRVHVVKIMSDPSKQKKQGDDFEDQIRPNVPFQGYRA